MSSLNHIENRRGIINSLFLLHFRNHETRKHYEIARDIGVKKDIFYKYTNGERSMKMCDFPAFFRAAGTKPLDILKGLIAECDPRLMLITIPDGRTPNGTFEDEKDGLAILHGELVKELRAARKDGHIDGQERQQLIDTALEVKKTIDDFIAEVNHAVATNMETGVRHYREHDHVLSVEA